MASSRPRTTLPRWRKLAYGTSLAVVALSAVELVGRVVAGPPPPYDMHARVSNCDLVRDGATVRLDCPCDNEERAFPGRTTDGRPRIVALGGSSVHDPRGRSFPTQLGELLPEADVVDLGSAGLSAANVALLSKQSTALSPDLLVIYSGHNDYNQLVFRGTISASRLWLLPLYRALHESWVHALLVRRIRGQDRPSSTHAALLTTTDDTALRARDDVERRFRGDLTLAVRAAPCPVVLCTLLRNPTIRPTGLRADPGTPCADAAKELGSDASPRVLVELAETACPDSAVGWWLRSRVAASDGKEDEAVRAFHESLARDPVPMRAPASTDTVIREVAEMEGATLVDLARRLGPLPPRDYFTDTLHLSVAGARAVAEVLAEDVRREIGGRGAD